MDGFTKEELKMIRSWFEFCEEQDGARGLEPTYDEEKLGRKIKILIEDD